jgi:hypothetical protein
MIGFKSRDISKSLNNRRAQAYEPGARLTDFGFAEFLLFSVFVHEISLCHTLHTHTHTHTHIHTHTHTHTQIA